MGYVLLPYIYHDNDGVDVCMRVSEGVPRGRIVGSYNPEMFQEHAEVIVLY